MSNMNIGLSGLLVAQQAIDIIGTNISNAATDGYHRQTPVITPVSAQSPQSPSTGGVEITDVRRAVDGLLESEIYRNQPLFGQLDQELMTLQSIESSIGTVGSQSLTNALNQFFGDMQELAAQPRSDAQQQQTVWSAESLTEQFRNLGNFLLETGANIKKQTLETIDTVNKLTGQIADLNTQVLAGISRGNSANLLIDQRDELVRQLSELVPIQTNSLAQTGSRDIQSWGAPLVIGSHATELRIGTAPDGQFGVAMKDSSLVETDVSGGRLGALFDLQNNVLSDLGDQLDTLATQVINSINRLHVQGLGSAGAFQELTGSAVEAGALTNADLPIEAGEFNIRVTDTATGEVSRYKIDVDPETDSFVDIAARLDNLDHVTSFVTDNRLRIKTDAGYTFDFRPGVEAEPTESTLTGTAEPTLSGNYSGDANADYTFTAIGTGEVGITDGLTLEVREDSTGLVNTLNIGSGYAAGERIAVADGVYVSLSLGTMNDGDQFTAEALAQSDTSGLLAAAGMNTLFTGDSALTMGVRQEVLDDASLLATAASAGGSDNLNALAMADLADTPQAALGDLTPAESLQFFVTSIGQRVALAKSRQESASQVMLQLENQRDSISGVDVNEEAANLMLMERLFQACSKVLTGQDQTLQDLLDMM